MIQGSFSNDSHAPITDLANHCRSALLKLKYELPIFLIFLIVLVNSIPLPNNMHDWCTTPYALTYKLGFGSRFFVGSFLSLFISPLSSRALYIFIASVMIFLSALVAWLLGKVIRRADDMQTMGMGLVVLYLASPASISFLFHPKNYGRFDAFLIIFTLLSLVIVNKAVLKWLLPLLCLVSMATHEVYLFTYMPIVAISLLHELSRSHFLKKNILLCTVFCVMIVSSFLYFQFFTPHLGFNNAKEMVSYLSLKTDIPINTDMIKSEYFSTISEHWNLYGMFSAEHWLLRLGKGIGCLILLSPLLGIFIFIWKEAIKITADKYSRSILILCLVAPFATLPAFVLALDWGRWFAAIIITQFCLVFYFMYAKNPEILTQLQRVEIYFKRHGYLYLFLIIYLLCLGGFSPETLNILDSVGAISKYFLGLS